MAPIRVAEVLPPPYRIESERLVVRCWEPRDAPLLKDAIDTSLDHLRPWMPWTRDEPQTLDEKIDLLRGFRSRFDAGEDFVYGIFSADESEALGGSGLHTRAGDGALEIGYWFRASATGRGIATKVVAVLTRVAFAVCDVDRVEIRVGPENERSLRIPRQLGYLEEARLRRRLPARSPGGPPRDLLIFSMIEAEFKVSAAAETDVAAYDAAGPKLI
jgi:RimJ/RimL family protein N-acetyltransferase